MSTPLEEVWAAAQSRPFQPVVGKNLQFAVGSVLLLLGLILTSIFALNRSIVNIGVLGVPASLALGFGAVYMICAVGVYV